MTSTARHWGAASFPWLGSCPQPFGRWGSPSHPHLSPFEVPCVFGLLEQRTGHAGDRDSGAETENSGRGSAARREEPSSDPHVAGGAGVAGDRLRRGPAVPPQSGSLTLGPGVEPTTGQLKAGCGRAPCLHGRHWPPLSQGLPQRQPFMQLSARGSRTAGGLRGDGRGQGAPEGSENGEKVT